MSNSGAQGGGNIPGYKQKERAGEEGRPMATGMNGVPENIAEMMVAIGRIEEKLSGYRDLEDRLIALEVQNRSIIESMPKKTPVPVIITSIAAIVAILIGLGTLSERQTIAQNREQLEQIEQRQTNLELFIRKEKEKETK